MPTPKKPCGCVDGSTLNSCDGRHGETCLAHTLPRFADKQARRSWEISDWYRQETCPFCGRSNGTGCACRESYTHTCETCGIHTCDHLNMAHYLLEAQHGLICPSTIKRTKTGKPSTKHGKATAAKIAEHPELNAALVDFPGKRVTPKIVT